MFSISGFTGPPRVEQLDLATVRVSWEGLVTQRECADQFLVKFWQRSNPQSYSTSELLDRNANSVDVKVVPKVDYQFQAVAREDKGPIVGIDWNKSPVTDFKTSVRNKEISKIPIPNEQPISTSPTDASLKSTSDAGGQVAVPTAAVSETKEKVLPLSIEVLAIIAVCGTAVLLIFVGVAYKLFCGKSEPVDEESCADDNDEDEENEEKEHLDSTASA